MSRYLRTKTEIRNKIGYGIKQSYYLFTNIVRISNVQKKIKKLYFDLINVTKNEIINHKQAGCLFFKSKLPVYQRKGMNDLK